MIDLIPPSDLAHSPNPSIISPTQSETPKAQATACASSRSCLVTYPIKEQYGLLWLWPDASPTAPLESAAAAPAVSVALDKHYAAGGDVNWYMRDLPYGGWPAVQGAGGCCGDTGAAVAACTADVAVGRMGFRFCKAAGHLWLMLLCPLEHPFYRHHEEPCWRPLHPVPRSTATGHILHILHAHGMSSVRNGMPLCVQGMMCWWRT